MQYTQEQIKERFDSLPQDVQDAISSVSITNDVVDIGEKYRIHIDQMGELVDETGLVMLGFTKSGDFVGNLKKRLGASAEVAESMVRDINDKILIKIRASLREIQQTPEKTDETESLPIDKVEKIETSQPKKENLDLERDKILRDIENPDGIQESVSDMLDEIDSAEVEEPKSESTDVGPHKNMDIIETKLKNIVQMPVKEKDIVEEDIEKNDKPEIVDPYREPIE